MTTYYPLVTNRLPDMGRNHRAKKSGEFRNPRKGEWFLSGAIPGAYLAMADLTSPYHILTVVKVKTVTTTIEVSDE